MHNIAGTVQWLEWWPTNSWPCCRTM